MLKLVVIQPGKPDRVVNVQGDVATVGRVAPANVVVDLPFVSKQHLRILHGTVAVDLGSSNGTFLEGRRLTEAVLLAGRTLAIGQGDVELRVEVDEAPAADTAPGDPDLESLRSRYVLLEAQVAGLQQELAEAREGDDRDVQLARMKGENESLRRRIESFRAQLEERESDDAESPQARLAMERVEKVRELNEQLQDEVERLRAEVAAHESLPAPSVDAPRAAEDDGALAEERAEVARLRAALEEERTRARTHQDQTELVRRLRKELEAQRAPRAAAAGTDLAHSLEESRKEAVALRARLAELEGRLGESKPAPEKNVSDLFFKLQGENAELRKKLAALEKAPAGDKPGAQREPKHVKELMEARFRIASLEAELAKASARKPVPAVPAVPAQKVPAPAPERPAASGGDIRRVLAVFVEKDIEGVASSVQSPVEEFVVAESLRLLRQVERVVTRLSGDLIQLLRVDRTMLPETTGNYRELVGGLLTRPDDASTRELLQEYLEKLARWLVASTGAHRKAALQFACKLRDDLSEKSLVARDPLPPYARVPMLAGNELWRRVQEYLQALSNDTIDERIEELARAQAQSILNSVS